MIEIVFSDSARGSLLCGQGVKNTVYGFELGLSMGDISRDVTGPERYDFLCGLCGFRPEEWQLERKLKDAHTTLPEILRRSAEGESVRLWYSDQPEELCGFCWMLEQLDGLKERCGPVSAIKLPQFEERSEHTLVEYDGWNEVEPEKWYEFLRFEESVSPLRRHVWANRWRELREENAPLRAMLNGQLISASEDLYDNYIRRELDRMEDTFQEARLIGEVIGRCRLGIGDGWIARRIDAMVVEGELKAVTRAAEGDLPYRRVLKKIAS